LIIWAIKKAFTELWIEPHQRVIVSWVWCSWKASQYIDWYAAETLHGRAIPFATWVKIAKPDMKVLVIGWDWDGFWIGLGHFLHACKRDLDITYLVFDNQNYALTTWQASPTTPIWSITKTTPNWNESRPFNPIEMAKNAWATFVSKANAAKFGELVEIIKNAITHSWFSFVDIDQACPSFRRWDNIAE